MFKPLNDLLLIKRLDSKTEEKNGLLLKKGVPRAYGEIVELGVGVLNLHNGKYNDFNFKINDIVIFETHRGHNIIIEGKTYLIVGMENILAVYKEEDMVNGKMTCELSVSDSTNQFGG